MARKYKNLVDRLLSNCAGVACRFLETQCWEWVLTCCHKHYARINVRENGRHVAKRAHIVLWELVNGRKVRDGYTLDHRCRNTRCIRPDHLEEVTRAENTARGNRARAKKVSGNADAGSHADTAVPLSASMPSVRRGPRRRPGRDRALQSA